MSIHAWIGHRLSKRLRRVGEIAPHTVLVEDPVGPLQPKRAADPSTYRAERPAAPWIPPPTEEQGVFDRLSALMAEDDVPEPATAARVARPKPQASTATPPASPAASSPAPPPSYRAERPAAPWIPPPAPPDPDLFARLKAFLT